MAYIISKATVDGVEFVGVYLTGTDMETASVGVAEATVTAAGDGDTTVSSPTTEATPGASRAGIDYVARGKLDRCAVCGFVYPIRSLIRQRGGWVCREDYDQLVPIRGRTGQVPSRRWKGFGMW